MGSSLSRNRDGERGWSGTAKQLVVLHYVDPFPLLWSEPRRRGSRCSGRTLAWEFWNWVHSEGTALASRAAFQESNGLTQ